VNTDRPELIVFDFDGVIADSMRAQEETLRRAVREIVGGEGSETERKIVDNLYAGRSGSRIFQGLGNLTFDQRTALRRSKDSLWEEHRLETEAVPGMREAVRRVSERWTTAIGTSSPRDYVAPLVERYGISDAVSFIVTDDEVERPKPAPQMLLTIGRKFEVSMNRLCMIGDSSTDARMAAAAGSPFIHFRTHTRHAANLDGEVSARDWDEVLQLLGLSRTNS
jgi:phosphoglycolate phosphatase-like HAD superfamily hydrolase